MDDGAGDSKAQEMEQQQQSCGRRGGEKWSELPEPLVDRVIARLPLSGLFQSRTLCKRWNSCFLSHEFRSMFAERLVQSRYMGLYVLLRAEAFDAIEAAAADGEGRSLRRRQGLGRDSVAYDFASKKWQKLPPPPRFPRTIGQARITGAGGLLLFSYISKEKRMLHVVCNLLSGQVRELPDTLLHNPTSAADLTTADDYTVHLKECSLLRMVMSKTRKSYWVVLVDDEQLTHVFDSSRNAWAVTGRAPLHPLVKCSSAYAGGRLFCLGLDTAGNYGIMCYNLQRAAWELVLRDMPRHRGQAVTNILERDESILLVTETDEMPANIKHVSVFKWDPTTAHESEWELVAEMPYETCGPCGDSYTCVSDKDRLLFSRIFVGSLQMAVYNFSQDSWERLRFGPYLGQGQWYQLVRFPFEPDWLAAV